MDQQTRWKLACHETGHAIMALRYERPIKEVSLISTDSYLASMKLEQPDPAMKLTGEWAIQNIMIALAGYASEMAILGRVENFITDDLEKAVDLTKDLLASAEFKQWLESLPVPNPGPWDVIMNPLIRTYVHRKFGECFQVLAQITPVVQLIAEELSKKDRLTGAEVNSLFFSVMPPRPRG